MPCTSLSTQLDHSLMPSPPFRAGCLKQRDEHKERHQLQQVHRSGNGSMRYSDSDIDQPSDDSDASETPMRRSKGSAKSGRARGPKLRTLNRWTPEEHDRLAYLVNKWGSEKNWAKVAEEMPGRTGKQCRERWLNHMKPGIIKYVGLQGRTAVVFRVHLHHGGAGSGQGGWWGCKVQLAAAPAGHIQIMLYCTAALPHTCPLPTHVLALLLLSQLGQSSTLPQCGRACLHPALLLLVLSLVPQLHPLSPPPPGQELVLLLSQPGYQSSTLPCPAHPAACPVPCCIPPPHPNSHHHHHDPSPTAGATGPLRRSSCWPSATLWWAATGQR